jgi:hypothetical protein
VKAQSKRKRICTICTICGGEVGPPALAANPEQLLLIYREGQRAYQDGKSEEGRHRYADHSDRMGAWLDGWDDARARSGSPDS